MNIDTALDERLGRAPSRLDVVTNAAIRAVFGLTERDILIACGIEPTPDAVFLDHVSVYALTAWNRTLHLAAVRLARETVKRRTTLAHARFIVEQAARERVPAQRKAARNARVDYLTGDPL